MRDIHTHVLPGIDDGSRNMESTVKMARVFVDSGVKEVVATPHFIRGSNELDKEAVINLTSQVNKTLQEKGLNLKILPGMEVEIFYEMIDFYKEDRLLTINNNNKYILVEPPLHSLPSFTNQVLYELQLQGIVPVLAHPERNAVICEDLKQVYDLVSRGVLIQVNAGSILGYFGGSAKHAALALLKNNLVHVLASDSHMPGKERGPCMHLIGAILQKIIGNEMAVLITVVNPQAIIEGKEVCRPDPVLPKRAGFWKRLFK
ncbi:MAG: tyrosine-protein phosphatase [Bacillota bacterium]|jgi:protein-tyrosine phosphatase